MKFKALLVALLVLAGGTAASAQGGCSGQPAPGRVCGNSAATTDLPSFTTQTLLLDRGFSASQGQILNRGASDWVSTATPTLGLNGGTGGSLAFKGATSGTATVSVAAAAGTTNFRLPVGNGTNGFVLVTDGSGNTSWANNAAGGTVQSVGLSLPAIFTVSGSPVTTTGTLTGTLATQTANQVWAGPGSGAAAAPTFRALVGADLPNPSVSTLGGVQSFAAVSSQWIRQISTSGVPTASQPAFSDISGTLAPAQCPNPSAITIGCVQSLAAVGSRWINAISTSGVPSATQPNFTDIAGSATLAQLPSIGNNSILGNISGGSAVPSAITATSVLDILGSTQGQVLYRNASAWVPLAPGTSGQVLTSGGAAANVAWATVSGTGTVTSVATGSGLTGGPITTTGTIQLATIANNTVLANVSGGALAPSSTAPTLILDIVGSTQGNILYRGASNWTVLAPGTNGQVLTQGASTPSWANAGTLTNVTIAAGTNIGVSGTCNISTTGTCTIANNGVRTIAGNTGAFTLGTGLTNSTNDIRVSLSSLTNSLTSNVNVTNGTYVTGPQVAQGTSGTWMASGTVTLLTAAASIPYCRLWDGTTVIAASGYNATVVGRFPIALSGVITNPAGNLRISCSENNGAPYTIQADVTGSGNKDSTVTVFRIAP